MDIFPFVGFTGVVFYAEEYACDPLFHSFTTRYNVYFNGITSFEEQLDAMQDGYEDNFTHLLHMHPVSAYGVPSDPQPKGDFPGLWKKPEGDTATFHTKAA